VRELKNAVERSVYRAATPETPISKIAFDPFDSPFKLAEIEQGKVKTATVTAAPLLPADLPARLVDMEREFLEAALERARFNQRMASKLLGLSYHQFRGRLRKLDISGRPPMQVNENSS
jgi:psp operon transcriptional activator